MEEPIDHFNNSSELDYFICVITILHKYLTLLLFICFIPEGEGVVEDEFEGRCLPNCFPAILDAAAQ